MPAIDHDAQRYWSGLLCLACQVDTFGACRGCLLSGAYCRCAAGIIDLPIGVVEIPAITGNETILFCLRLRNEGAAVGLFAKALQPVVQAGNRQWPSQCLFGQDVDIAGN